MRFKRKLRRFINRYFSLLLTVLLCLTAIAAFAKEGKSNVFALIFEDKPLHNGTTIQARIYEEKNTERFERFDMEQIVLTGNLSILKDGAYKIEWKELKNTVTNKFALLPTVLHSSDTAQNGLIKRNETVLLNGNINQIEPLLETLFEQSIIQEEKEEETVIETKKSSYEAMMGETSTLTSSGQEKPYDASAIKVNEKQEDTITWTFEECAARVDMDNLQVFPQTSAIKHVNGQITEKGECTDSDLPYTIFYTESGCTAEINLQEMKVYGMHRPYYMKSGEQVFLGECVRDEEKTYIVHENASCTPLIDFSSKMVKEQSLLYYDDPKSASTVIVSECQPRDTTRIFDLFTTYDTCSFRPDTVAKIAYQQEKTVYKKDDALISVTGCTDSDLTYTIEDEFCEYKNDWANGNVVRYERQKVNTVNGLVYLTDCLPVASGKIEETSDGCESMHADYFEARYSKGYSRFYHIENGKKIYITGCQENNIVYNHEYKIEDWRADFETNEAVALLSPYIVLLNGETIRLKPPAEYAESLRVPLAKQSEEIRQTANFKDIDCVRFFEQEKITTYLLPNGKTVEHVEPVSETKAVEICQKKEETRTIEYVSTFSKTNYCSHAGNRKSYSWNRYTAVYSRTKLYNTVTGQTECSAWTQTSKTSTSGSCGNCYFICETSPLTSLHQYFTQTCGTEYIDYTNYNIRYNEGTAQCVNNVVVPLDEGC